jgi:hypothetical protein
MMKKISIIIASIILVLVMIAFAFSLYIKSQKIVVNGEMPPTQTASDVKSIAYTIDGQKFDLKNGRAEIDYSLDLASKNSLSIFGEPVYGDIDGDGDPDAAILLVNEPGGSGTFYYAVLAMNNGTTEQANYIATNALLIGDRIAPQTVEIKPEQVVYNYAERQADEPMTTAPSVGKSFFIQFDKSTGQIKNSSVMSESEAKVIAEKSCIKGGEALGIGTYNINSKTWWFDANLNATREGCNPACVVSEESQTAEINWRCTGAIRPGVTCPQDAKLCPDGSTVGRDGANCEFTPCGQADTKSVSVSEELKKLFRIANPEYKGLINISINQQTSNHIRGGVSFVDEQAGGIFLATKINGTWQIVFDGNGTIPCSLSKYSFPSTMLNDCVN